MPRVSALRVFGLCLAVPRVPRVTLPRLAAWLVRAARIRVDRAWPRGWFAPCLAGLPRRRALPVPGVSALRVSGPRLPELRPAAPSRADRHARDRASPRPRTPSRYPPEGRFSVGLVDMARSALYGPLVVRKPT
ncbi:hypothetical protein SVIO_096570 [Streptomyces violaceusniger]|uniref:Uncharacterized protein n=1 Tax=Streptomyces violaceusniger TaxID=68280 RepID=A0A4D4LF92_STRVO|nr:hypothetical protein SVIO_096570 [Streptomyces violaceusniger]